MSAEAWVRHVQRLREACRKRAFVLYIHSSRVYIQRSDGEFASLNQHQQIRLITDERFNPFRG